MLKSRCSVRVQVCADPSALDSLARAVQFPACTEARELDQRVSQNRVLRPLTAVSQ